MRRPHTLLAALLLAAGTAAAQDYGQAATLKIWDNTTAPHSNGIATPEREPEPNRIADVSQAVLYIFPADPAKATGQAVVICCAILLCSAAVISPLYSSTSLK